MSVFRISRKLFELKLFFKFYVWFCFVSSHLRFLSSIYRKFVYTKFGKQISLTQLKFRSVILVYHAVKEDLSKVTCLSYCSSLVLLVLMV